MFDVAPTELLLVAVVALVVIGPKDLPRVMRTVGHWVGRARGVARHFRAGIDTMIREAELEELEQKWKAENERILAAHPMVEAEPLPPPPAALPAGGESQAEAGERAPAPPPSPLPDSQPMLPLSHGPAAETPPASGDEAPRAP